MQQKIEKRIHIGKWRKWNNKNVPLKSSDFISLSLSFSFSFSFSFSHTHFHCSFLSISVSLTPLIFLLSALVFEMTISDVAWLKLSYLSEVQAFYFASYFIFHFVMFISCTDAAAGAAAAAFWCSNSSSNNNSDKDNSNNNTSYEAKAQSAHYKELDYLLFENWMSILFVTIEWNVYLMG